MVAIPSVIFMQLGSQSRSHSWKSNDDSEDSRRLTTTSRWWQDVSCRTCAASADFPIGPLQLPRPILQLRLDQINLAREYSFSPTKGYCLTVVFSTSPSPTSSIQHFRNQKSWPAQHVIAWRHPMYRTNLELWSQVSMIASAERLLNYGLEYLE